MLSEHRRFRFTMLLIALIVVATAHQTMAVESTITLPVQVSIPRFLLVTLTSGEVSESQSTASGTLNLKAPILLPICTRCGKRHATVSAGIQSNANWRLSLHAADLPPGLQWNMGELHDEAAWDDQAPVLSGEPTEWVRVTVHLRTSGEAPVGGIVVASAMQE